MLLNNSRRHSHEVHSLQRNIIPKDILPFSSPLLTSLTSQKKFSTRDVYTFGIHYLWWMKNLSLKLDDEIFLETEKVVEKLGTTRNRYINEALAIYNKYYNRKMLRDQLVKESRAAYGSSRDILDEYERLIDED